jgi:hypothetical protein
MGTRHATGVRSPCKNDFYIAGGVHRLHHRLIQPHRRDYCRNPPHTRNSPLHDRLPHVERRNRGDGRSAIQGASRSPCLARTRHSPRHSVCRQLACSFRAQPWSRPLGCGQMSSPLPQGNEGVAPHPWRKISGGRHLHRR